MWMYEICFSNTAKTLHTVLAGNNAGRGAWRWQGEAVKVSDLDDTTSMQLTIAYFYYNYEGNKWIVIVLE